MQVHDLKTWPNQFQPVWDGRKLFTVRYDDRAFKTGDTLVLREWHPLKKQYTGRRVMSIITYIAHGQVDFADGKGQAGFRLGLSDGHCVLGFRFAEKFNDSTIGV